MAENRKQTRARVSAAADLRTAVVEAHRWCLVTAWQLERYVEAAGEAAGSSPDAGSPETLADYYEKYDRMIAEVYFAGTAVTELSRWLRPAGIKAKGEHRDAVAVIRTTAASWKRYQRAERGALGAPDRLHEPPLARTTWSESPPFDGPTPQQIRQAANSLLSPLAKRLDLEK